ncbi:Zinc finger, ZZ-type [Penicillium camemberti]|uniref:Zinc finger, ZZ-type n=1 Tax=Penicillium camemberti (strain FM 013) TaxID=1429867 RepID=A0A0G4NZK3_PENC3|nr:Zinc finger, ZZ-type [Penicillium camemberti]
MAAAANLVDLIEPVVSDVKDVAIRNMYGDTALHLAARWGHVTAGKILRGKGADQDAKNESGKTPLFEAASNGNLEFVEWLLDEGVDLGKKGDRGALQAASLGGYESVVEILLGAGADVNAQGGYHGNALQAAGLNGSPETVQILLGAGADVNAQGVQILLGAGADVNAQGGEYGNALQAAARHGSPEKVQILLGAGADVNAQGGEYSNALQAAALNRSPKTVQILLGAGADVNAQGGRYGLPLLAAIHEGYVDQVQILLHAGADSLLADELGRTPLHIAASKNKLHILRRFPQLLSALNKRSDFLQTPLHLAVCLGHIEFAIGLLNSGADPSLPDGYGKHVMDWASGHEALLQEIHNHCPYLVFTPPDTQELSVHRSLYELIESHPYSKSKSSWPILQQLGRFFLFLGQFDNARYLFQLHLRQDASSKTDIWQISCNMCNQIITGTRFICRLCACIDICSSCV